MRWLALLIGFGVAIGCARLGIWQLDRHAQRRAWNAEVEARLAEPPILLTSASAGMPTDSLTYRRARAAGTFAYGDQTVELNRSLRGVPGVFVLTPLRFADGTGVLVNRGWAFAPDGRTADLRAIAEAESTLVEGVLLPPVGRFAVWPDSLDVAYPLYPLILRRTTGPAPQGLTPAPIPPRDAGPHLSYAFQWFAFGVIALVGGVVLARRPGRERDRRV